MARKSISEFRTKTLLYQELGMKYAGIQVNNTTKLPLVLDPTKMYVVKVDEGIKGRFKKGLLKLAQSNKEIPDSIAELKSKGHSQLLVEEIIEHKPKDEKYLSIERTREGFKIMHSATGGVDIESYQEAIHVNILSYSTKIPNIPGLPNDLLTSLIQTLNKYYFSFLEINPFLILNTKYFFLDAAAEVDSTAEFFVNRAWTENDFTNPSDKKTTEEIEVQRLATKSQAAFSLEVLNPKGSIFMMLSGGGASIVLADEVYNQGYGKELANYGEYSGNPSIDETYLYAKNIISLLLKSKAEKRVLIIAGGVANFTDVRITFNGLIKALDEKKHELQKQKIKIFVRRGGPYQEQGLNAMKTFLEKEDLLGIVAGPEMVLTDIVTHALTYLKNESA